MFKSIKVKLLVVVGFLTLLAIMLSAAISYQNNIAQIEKMLGEKAKGIAATAALLLDADRHTKASSNIRYERASSELLHVNEQLKKVKKENQLETDIYTLTILPDNPDQMIFVANSSKSSFSGAVQKTEPHIKKAMQKKIIDQRSMFTTENGEWISGYASIVDKEGKISGVVEVALDTTKGVKKIQNQFFLNILYSSVTALLFCLFIVYLVSIQIAKPLQDLSMQAEKLSDGDLNVKVEPKGKDELFRLGNSFNHMASNLKSSYEKLDDYNKNLEKMVEEKTERINLILNNVSSGFLLVDEDLKIQAGFSKSCLDIFPNSDNLEGSKLASALGLTTKEQDHFDTCYKEIFCDILPEEVTLEQCPKVFSMEDLILELEAGVIRGKSDEIKYLLFNIRDITSLVKAREENRKNESLLNILGKKSFFVEFLETTKELLLSSHQLIASNNENSEKELRMNLHTLKGNAGMQNLYQLASLIHKVEDKSTIEAKDIDSIEQNLKEFLQQNSEILEIEYDQLQSVRLIVDGMQLDHLDKILEVNKLESLKQSLKGWRKSISQVGARQLFAPFKQIVEKTAEKLGKEVNFELKGGDVLLDPEAFKEVNLVLPHLLRNNVDHGIEAPYEREDKNPCGSVVIEISDHNNHWQMRIEDDGKGINTDALKAKAIKEGQISAERLETMPHSEAVRLIFQDGVSTAESVSEISGRGVGMAAVLKAVEDIGGSIEVESEVGKGTRFIITIPKENSLQKPTAA